MTELIKEKQNLTYLEWSKIRKSSGTAGSFLKSASEISGDKIYYKLSNYDQIEGVVGHESVNELIVDRLLNILGIDHLHYDLIHADIVVDGKQIETYLCASHDFKKRGEEKVALDVFCEAEKQPEESSLDFCIRMGFEEYVYEMFLVDYLILNRDRHGANIEVLKDPKAKTLRLAPLFDHGLSLLAPCRGEEAIIAFDVLEDRPVQSFPGSRSAYENLKLIPADKLPKVRPLRAEDKPSVMEGIEDILGNTLTEKIWDMIWKRWCRYEDICDQK